MVLAFDTYRAVKGLRDAGFEEAQAEAVVTVVGEVTDGRLATKDDLERFATKTDLAEFRTELRDDLKGFATKTDLKGFATKTDLERFATKTDLAELNVGIYRHLWVMGAGMLGLHAATAGLIIALKLFS